MIVLCDRFGRIVHFNRAYTASIVDTNFPRLLDMLAVLQRTGTLSTSDIRLRLEARGHRVTARTVQRDLEDLASVYPLECDRRSKPYGWRWRADAARLALPGMDWPEAVSFHLLDTYLTGVLPNSVREGIEPYVQEARRRLSQQFEDLPLRRWPERVRVISAVLPVHPPKIRRAVHVAWTEAVLLGRKLRVAYKGFGQMRARDWLVAPLGLVQNGAVFYSPVRFESHQDVRTIALHRVQRAEIVDEPSDIQNFDLSAWLASGAMGFGGDERIALELRLSSEAAELLQEAPLSDDQEIGQDKGGDHRLKATLLDTVQLRIWLLGQGARITVLKPSALRQWVGRELEAAAATYRR